MIGVLLTILKVIGILLLVILAVLLFLILFVTISPIVYESAGNIEKETLDVRVKVHWLLKILRISVAIKTDQIRIQVKILFFKVFGKSIPWHYPLAPKAEDEPETAAEAVSADTQPVLTERPETAVIPEKTETPVPESSSQDSKPQANREPESENTTSTKPEPAKEKTEKKKTDKKKDTENKEKQNKIKKKDKKTDKKKKKSEPGIDGSPEEAEKKESILDKVKTGWDYFQKNNVKKTILLVKRQVFKILRHILPRKMKINMTVGTGDPAMTGKILGYFYRFYPVYQNHGEYRLVGDFENTVVKGKYYFKGRIVPIFIIGCALRLLFDKNIRKLIFRKGGKNGK